MPKMGDALGKVATKLRKEGKPEEEKANSKRCNKVYLKAFPLRELKDVDVIKREVKSGNILILKVSPLARRSIEDVKQAVNELLEFTRLVGGDIARLGEERVVITPSSVKIWREKTIVPNEALPTAA